MDHKRVSLMCVIDNEIMEYLKWLSNTASGSFGMGVCPLHGGHVPAHIHTNSGMTHTQRARSHVN